MNRSRFPILVIASLIALAIIVLATFSYKPDPTAKPTQRGDGWHEIKLKTQTQR